MMGMEKMARRVSCPFSPLRNPGAFAMTGSSGKWNPCRPPSSGNAFIFKDLNGSKSLYAGPYQCSHFRELRVGIYTNPYPKTVWRLETLIEAILENYESEFTMLA